MQKRLCFALACLLLALLVVEDDRVKMRGATQKWNKRRKEEDSYANLVEEVGIEDNRKYIRK